MKEHMTAYPEIVFFDGTYNLFENNLVLMIWCVEDKLGKTHITSAGIVSDETEPTIEWLWKNFRDFNFEACRNISCIMTDKDLTARPVISNVIPHAQLLICSFHSAKIFGTEITCAKRGITEEVRQNILLILNKMTKSLSQTEYLRRYLALKDVAPASVMQYFDTNWHIYPEQWVYYAMFKTNNLGNTTNNRIESLNGRIKTYMKIRDKIVPALKNLFSFIRTEEKDMKFVSVQNIIKRKVGVFSEDNEEKQKYRHVLAKPVFIKLNNEIEMKKYVSIHIKNEKEMIGTFQIRDTVYEVSPTRCECPTWTGSRLPCKHIFHIRKRFGLPLFNRNLLGRWALDDGEINDLNTTSSAKPCIKITSASQNKKLSENQKKSELKPLVNNLLYSTLRSPQHMYERRLRVLVELDEAWRMNEEVLITRTGGNQSHLIGDMSNLSVHEESNQEQPIEDNSSSEPVLFNSDVNLKHLSLPAPIKNIGRTSELTSTLKIPKKKKAGIQFKDKDIDDQTQYLLACFINSEKISMVMSGESLLSCEEIPQTIADLPDPLTHDSVNLVDLEKCIGKEIMDKLTIFISEKKKLMKRCKSCQNDIQITKKVSEGFFCCACCLFYFHRQCKRIKKIPETGIAFCKTCK